MPDDLPAPGAVPHLGDHPPITFKGVLLGSGPRFARDAFGPVATFYVVWKLVGLVPGIIAATVVALIAVNYQRRRDRQAVLVKVSLAFVVIQAVIGIITRSAEIYLLQPIIINAAYGLVFIGSAAIGRPLAGVFAKELYAFPEAVHDSGTFKRVFTVESYAWGAYQLFRSGLRATVLLGFGVDIYVVVNFLTGFPMMAGMVSWSIWYAVRSFRHSEEWGWAMEAMEEGTLPPTGEPSEA